MIDRWIKDVVVTFTLHKIELRQKIVIRDQEIHYIVVLNQDIRLNK